MPTTINPDLSVTSVPTAFTGADPVTPPAVRSRRAARESFRSHGLRPPACRPFRNAWAGPRGCVYAACARLVGGRGPCVAYADHPISYARGAGVLLHVLLAGRAPDRVRAGLFRRDPADRVARGRRTSKSPPTAPSPDPPRPMRGSPRCCRRPFAGTPWPASRWR